jgi:hypothetical protein
MNPDTLIAVHAYAGDAHQVENNLPLYTHHGCQVCVLSPVDAPIPSVSAPGVVCHSLGLKGWIGPHTLERQRLHMEFLLKFPQNYFLCNDADSFCLSAKLPDYLYANPDVIFSNEVQDLNPAPSLLPKIAMQPPYALSRKAMEGMLRVWDTPPTSYYEGADPANGCPVPTSCVDHRFFQAAEGSGFKHHSFFTGASFETGTEHGANEMENLVRNHGRVLIHSVKTKSVMERLIRAHSDYRRAHPHLHT